jgi:hypothetical protein
MGHRTVKRVPSDFDWPLNEPWQGYVNPHDRACDVCAGSGATAGAQALRRLSDLMMFMCREAAKTQSNPEHRPHPSLRQLGITQPDQLTGELVELMAGLAGRSASPFGHDSVDAWQATRKLVAAAGLRADSWGICLACGGEGQDPATKTAAEAWQDYEPPSGPCWQLWETTSEGSPISPVFDSPEKLAKWAAKNSCLFAGLKATYEDWLACIQGRSVELASLLTAENVT